MQLQLCRIPDNLKSFNDDYAEIKPYALAALPSKTEVTSYAAAGTVIATCKVCDGVEDGSNTVAKVKPEIFADTLSLLAWLIR